MTWIIQFPLRRIILYTPSCPSPQWPSPSAFNLDLLFRLLPGRNRKHMDVRKHSRVNKRALKQTRGCSDGFWLHERSRPNLGVLAPDSGGADGWWSGAASGPRPVTPAPPGASLFNINVLSEPSRTTAN